MIIRDLFCSTRYLIVKDQLCVFFSKNVPLSGGKRETMLSRRPRQHLFSTFFSSKRTLTPLVGGRGKLCFSPTQVNTFFRPIASFSTPSAPAPRKSPPAHGLRPQQNIKSARYTIPLIDMNSCSRPLRHHSSHPCPPSDNSANADTRRNWKQVGHSVEAVASVPFRLQRPSPPAHTLSFTAPASTDRGKGYDRPITGRLPKDAQHGTG